MDEPAQDATLKLRELEETVRRAVEELRSLRARLKEPGETVQRLEAKLLELETERAQVRTRIEALVAQIDSLTEAEQ